ncbi:MAG TPA: hypothetical protein VEJ18_11260 [Planctomycetota bacterium]|nr:hypothetical protein [Planctomycetota bacterium]
MDPLSLDWGPATAEFENAEAKSAVHMFMHDVTTADRAARALRFARARVTWCAKKMAPGTVQEVWVDDREKPAPKEVQAAFKDGLAIASGVMFMSAAGEEA